MNQEDKVSWVVLLQICDDQAIPSVIKSSSNVQLGTSRIRLHSETVINLPNQAADSGVGKFCHTETVLNFTKP